MFLFSSVVIVQSVSVTVTERDRKIESLTLSFNDDQETGKTAILTNHVPCV